MNVKRHITPISLLLVFLFSFIGIESLQGQRAVEGTPISFDRKHKAIFSQSNPIQKVPKLNLAKLRKEDEENSSNRFAAPSNVSYTLDNSGKWYDLEDGGRVWKLTLQADGMSGLTMLYKNFYIPNGARLYVYDKNQTQVKGAYTYQNNLSHGKFLTGVIEGETAIIEYYEPWYAKGKGHFEIYQVMLTYNRIKYESDYEFQNFSGFGESLPCHENVNCSYANDLENQKRGVVRMLTVYNTAMGWCTGSLVNNTNNDGMPYVLSAHHCGFLGANIPDFSLWRFDFNYQFSGCANETTEPNFSSILSSEVVSGSTVSDYLLLELSSNIPSAYNAYFNGWDKRTIIPDGAIGIHHPFGDVKKVSVDTHMLESYPFNINWGSGVTTGPHSHFRSEMDIGTIEGGSSGSPYFNSNKKIVGQLHGGVSNCNTFITYYGKLSESWEAGNVPEERLLDWLDPIGSGVDTLEGIENPLLANSANILGQITLEDGTPVPSVEIQMSGNTTGSVNNQTDGSYDVVDLEIGNNYTITPFRNDNHKNGVNTIDLVLMRSHILGIGTPLTPYQIIAGDVNQDGQLNTFDMLLVQKIIKLWDTEFANSTSWRFIPADYVFQDPSKPLSEPFPEMNFYEPLLVNIEDQNFIAIKVGDLNNSNTP